MTDIFNLSRRGFLGQLGLGGAALVIGMAPTARVLGAANKQPEPSDLGYFVSVFPSGDVSIICHRTEMGQGILTSVPQIIADELGAEWERVTAVLGKADSRYGDQSTGGSASIRRFYTHIRQMGAVARTLLERAAAQQWAVPESEVSVANHHAQHIKTGRTLPFAALAGAASKLPMPDPQTVKLKPSSELTLTGRDVKLQGHEEIVTGQAMYAQDIQLPGLLIASIERPPVVGGKVASFDDKEAKKVAGVVAVLKLKDRPLPVNVKPVSGVAVLATNTWAAIEGRKKLKVQWELGEHKSHNSAAYATELMEKVQKKGVSVRSKGDVYAHAFDSNRSVESTYLMPYHHHMSMETPAATAWFDGDVCRVWTGTQTPQWAKNLIIEELSLDAKKDSDKVEVNVTLMGGAFGRKGKNDFTLEAVELAKAIGKPVKVVWSREDDVKHGFYHSIAANYYKAELNQKGEVTHWIQRVAHPPIDWTFDNNKELPGNFLLAQGFADIPFALNQLACETHKVSTHVRIGWFRAVQNLHNWFSLGCFVDELATKAQVTTDQMWLRLLGKSDRVIDPTQEGFSDWNNYQQSSQEYAVTTSRMKKTIAELVDKSGCNGKVAKDEGWGIAFSNSFNSYSAAATKVRVKGNEISLLEMHTVIDCGLVITPDRVKSQMEGAMIMGISLALDSEITVKNGAIEQSNFHDYTVSRMPEVPPLYVHIMPSKEAPGGVGEPGLPSIVPSIVNAIYHASGKRIKQLPVKKQLA